MRCRSPTLEQLKVPVNNHFVVLSRIYWRIFRPLRVEARLTYLQGVLPQSQTPRLDRVSTGGGSDMVKRSESRIIGNVAC
jgi:hypothetical protein